MSVDDDTAIVVWLDSPNVAMPVGTKDGDQLVIAFQSPDPGLASHAASCAWDGRDRATSAAAIRTVEARMRPERNACSEPGPRDAKGTHATDRDGQGQGRCALLAP